MTESTSNHHKQNDKDRYLGVLRDSLEQNTFVKLVLGKYRGEELELKRILVRRLIIKGQDSLSFVYCFKTNEITKNHTVAIGVETITELLGNPFLSSNLFSLSEDSQIEFSKKGKCIMSCKKAIKNSLPSENHNRNKERFIDQNSPFLTALGVTNDRHLVVPSKARKWKQINKFLEIFQHAFASSKISKTIDVHVADFGSGKGYLTFAIHEYLRGALNLQAQVTGIELRDNLVGFCNDTAKSLAFDTLHFYQGDVSSYAPEAINVMIALHACDTATDQAIYLGIRTGAEIIMCAPCCHKQIRPQICNPEVMEPMLQFGVHLGQEAEMLTDSLRALYLESQGYATQILEFVSLEHTSKNKMILAVKHDNTVEREAILVKIDRLKDFYGIKEHCLETLLYANGYSVGGESSVC